MRSLRTSLKKTLGSKFCTYCRLSRDEGWVDFNTHRKAAMAGCPCCLVIVQGLQLLVEKHSLFSTADWKEGAKVWTIRDDPNSKGWGRVLCVRTVDEEQFAAQFYVDADEDGSSDLLLDTRRHIKDVNVPQAAMDFAAEALHECARSHLSCTGSGEATVPKRLIELTSTSPGEDIVRLVDNAASSIPPGTRYAALSYCWGHDTEVKSAMLSMTRANLSEFTVDFPASRLPAVFQDAVTTIRSLGIKFLWIDALCIAQGDPDEWRTESFKMRETYTAAYVTIVASSSASCAESFLAFPDRSFSEGIQISADNEKIHRRPFVRLASCANKVSSFNEEERSAVNGRGWALQEALLSRRLLEFRHNCVAYSCLESSLAEDDDFLAGGSTMDVRHSWRMLFEMDPKKVPSFKLPPTMWKDLIQNYSARQLTVALDRLPAIAGVASFFKDKGPRDNSYLAGLWEASFVQDLAWWCARKRTRYDRLGGPSWSWASVNTHVLFNAPGEGDPVYTRLVECSRQYGLDGEFGGLNSAEATLEGPRFQMRLSQAGTKATINPTTVRTDMPHDPALPGDVWHDAWYSDYPLEAVQIPDAKTITLRPLLSSTGTDELNNHEAIIDLLLLFTDNVADGYQYPFAVFLALARSDMHEDRYIRIGLYERFFHTKPDLEGGRVLPRLNAKRRRKICSKWLASLETKRFVVI